MINIYDSTETNFSHNGICSLDEKRELIKCTIHRKLEGAYEGTLFISKENLKWTEFIEGRILKLPVDINGRTQLFRIFDTSDDFTDLEVYFKHIFFDLDDFFIEDTNIVEKDGRGAINQILNTTVDSHRFTATSDIDIINNCRIVDKTVTEAIGVDENCFLNRWGGEIDYDNFKFKINEKIGSDNGYRISLRKNLKAINGDISITEVATKLKIKGYDGIKLDEYLISPLANAYPHFKTRVVKFDDIKVKSDPDNPEEEGYETLQAAQLEMRRRGLELFSKQNIDKPTVNFEIDIDEMREENIDVGVLEVLSIGDIATLELEDFLRSNIEVKQRVIELEFDCIRKINIKVVLGESTSTIFKEVSKIESMLNDINNKLGGNSWQDILDKSMEQATDIIAEGFKDSHVIPRKNEIIVADNIDLNLAKKVIVINKNGIGFSLDGYRPDRLTLAMTIDGEINASCIKFGSMSGAFIKAGTIEADRLSVKAKESITSGLVKETTFDVTVEGIKSEVNKKIENLNMNFDINLLKNTLPHNNTEWQALNGSVSFVTSDTELKIHIINTTKQADAILIQENDKNILVDCGYNSTINIVIEYLKNNGVGEIDLFIATHAHTDHIGAFEEIANAFNIKEVIYREANWNVVDVIEYSGWGTSAAHRKMLEVIKNKNIFSRESKIIDVIKISNNGELRLINTTNEVYDEYNTRSLGVLYTHYNHKILLASDMTIESEKHCLGEIGKVDVLKVGHHGANGSNHEAYLEEIKPRYGLITTMDIDHIDRKKALGCLQWEGIPMYDTGTNGTFIITSTKHDLSVSNLNTEYKLKNQWWYRRTINNFEEWVYFKSNGSIARNETVSIGGGLYEFDENGICKEPY
ncbi:phage endopeptidase [Clostridium perfringens]|uniref:phage tail spike protein n=1 Tax=Clostridium perfringens TaxID=1502 RepID=UPI000E15EEC9|nr:phage tail spike protein [Clostridium perfringens]SUY33359.1 phage endopeptidase [Clostridium perfringens]